MIRRVLLVILLTAAGLLLALKLVPAEQDAVTAWLENFPDADAWAHQLRPAIVAALCFIPALGGLAYALAGTLTRYITRQFLVLLGLSFAALAVIWLLLDFQDNYEEMRQSREIAATAAKLYAARFPELVVTLLPYALLLSLLFCLGRLSNSREIVAMIQTGRGVARLTTPFLISGILAATLCVGLNYHWAPNATASEKQILDRSRGLDVAAAEYVQFRNPRVPRLWMVGFFPPDFQQGAPLRRIRIIRENDNGTLRSVMTASSASWNPKTSAWSFADAALRKMVADEPPYFDTTIAEPYVIKTWRETPAEIIQPGLPASQLGIPALSGWLKTHTKSSDAARRPYLTQWHHRWAQPVNCIILVLLATPLGIVFTRRGASGGVAVTVFLCAGLLFLTNICLSLGDAGHLRPILAAWLPNLVFGLLALYLFRRRLTGRPIYQSIRRLMPVAA